jgi:hypothetical protein
VGIFCAFLLSEFWHHGAVELGRVMSKSRIATIERPRCPNCYERMMLIRSTPHGSCFEVRTFECAKCGQAKIIETKDPFERSGRLA